MQKRKRRPVDRAQRLLGILGWSYGDLSYRRRDGHCVWQVYADHRWSAGSREKTVGTTGGWRITPGILSIPLDLGGSNARIR